MNKIIIVASLIGFTALTGCLEKGGHIDIKESQSLVKYDMSEGGMRYVIYSNCREGGVDIVNVTLDSLNVYKLKQL